jgi:hypothetical protein
MPEGDSGGGAAPFVRAGILRFKIEHYRAKAAEAGEDARHATDENSRALYRRAAQSWVALAQEADPADTSHVTSPAQIV